ncbi:MAG TPA: flagellar motor protein MotD [Candidatus Tenderia sp.]|nr:flagellar motor protein MotD [Candidatus Tenderia sp.]
MARRKKQQEHENHERWLVSYADFITLLFAFFVVMYSISSVNEGKYRVLSDAMITAFSSPSKSLEPIQIGEPIKMPLDMRKGIGIESVKIPHISLPVEEQPVVKVDERSMQTEQDKKNMQAISDKIMEAMSGLIDTDQIKVRRTDKWIEVEISSKILFQSGGALLQYEAVPVLVDLAKILRQFPNSVRVEGFTDNLPISTDVFPSNWELSAARAASVVHLFTDEGVDPTRLAAIGYGEYRPIADNRTPQGRIRNRRVVVFILSEEAERLYNRAADDATRFGPEEANVDLDVNPAPKPSLALPEGLEGIVRENVDINDAQFESIINSLRPPEIDTPQRDAGGTP